MEDARLTAIVTALRDLLRPHLEQSEADRRLATAVGEWLIEEAARAPPSRAPEEAPAETAPPPAADSGPVRAADRVPGAWTLGQLMAPAENQASEHDDAAASQETQESSPISAPDRPAPISLDLIAERCLLKAVACRIAVDRRRSVGDPVAEPGVIERIVDVLARARALDNCFLWMLYRERSQPSNETLGLIGECYDALGAAATLVRRVDEAETSALNDVENAFQCLAQAVSALRMGLADSWLTRPDADQQDAHDWLRDETSRRQVFVPHHMRLDDPADPASARDLTQRATALIAGLDARAEQAARRHALFQQIRYHVRRIESEPGEADSHDLSRIVQALDDLLALGTPTSAPRFHTAMPPHVAAEAVETASGRTRGLLERLATGPERGASHATATEPQHASGEWSRDVHQARQLLAGRQVVMIGGEEKVEATRRIEEAFDLENLCWVRLTEHGSSDAMRAPILRDETVAVLILVKLAGHQHVDDATALAKAAGKPCVRLPAGYNPEQIAAAVLAQASEQIAASPPP